MNDHQKNILGLIQAENNHIYALTIEIEGLLKTLGKTRDPAEFCMVYSTLSSAIDLLRKAADGMGNICTKDPSSPKAH